MFVKSIDLKKNRGKILWGIILFAIIVAISLISITVYLVKEETSGIKDDLINKKDGIFYMASYYADYSLTIKSNKNTNNYMIKEWYKTGDEKEYFKFESTYENGDIIIYEFKDNTLRINNSNQKNEFFLSEYIVRRENVISIATFVDIYIKIHDKTEFACCKLEEVEEDNKTSYKIRFGENECDICSNASYILRDGIKISCIELLIDNETNLPTELFIYDKHNTVYIDISYNEFTIHPKF